MIWCGVEESVEICDLRVELGDVSGIMANGRCVPWIPPACLWLQK